MGITYGLTDRETEGLIADVMQQHHPDLHSIKVMVKTLFAFGPVNEAGEKTGPAIKVGGYRAAACTKVQSIKQRVLGNGDALMILDGDDWPDWTDEERRALVDHELTHLEPQIDADKVAQTDDIGRPKLKARLHDWQLGGFREVVKRHGAHSFDQQQVDRLVESHGQYLFPYMAPGSGKPGKPESGAVGTRGADELVDDPKFLRAVERICPDGKDVTSVTFSSPGGSAEPVTLTADTKRRIRKRRQAMEQGEREVRDLARKHGVAV